MTGDELDRAIEFLVKNQADSDARMGRLEAAQAETHQQIRDLTVAQKGTQQQISSTQLQLNHLSNVVAIIAETTQRNSENIDALVKLVGGLVEGRNGKRGN